MCVYLSTKCGVSILQQLVFTPKCFVCSKLGFDICSSCIQQIKPFRSRDLVELNACFCAGEYTGWLREAVIGYKNGNASHARFLSTILRIVLTELQPYGPVTLVPIPSSDQKKQERGFDTMTNLCKRIVADSPTYKLDATNLYLRRKVADQVGLSGALRQENLEGAFGARQNVNGTFVLVDDVITTGSTLNSAAKSLRLAGAQGIYALALCGTPKTR
jgi:ComF family protein